MIILRIREFKNDVVSSDITMSSCIGILLHTRSWNNEALIFAAMPILFCVGNDDLITNYATVSKQIITKFVNLIKAICHATSFISSLCYFHRPVFVQFSVSPPHCLSRQFSRPYSVISSLTFTRIVNNMSCSFQGCVGQSGTDNKVQALTTREEG